MLTPATSDAVDSSTVSSDLPPVEDSKPLMSVVPDRSETLKPSTHGRVLVVDDEHAACIVLAEVLREEGYETRTANSGQAALTQLASFQPEVVLTDLFMPDIDGLELFERGHPLIPHAAFVLMTAQGSVGTAVAAMKKGVENYLEKPLDLERVSAVIHRALQRARLSEEAANLREQQDVPRSFDRILGGHPSMQKLFRQIAQVAKSRATVLIHGESGTGKELIATAIHNHSERRAKPFVRLNCASLAETLLESELFGHEKGSFTGAAGRRDGRFSEAAGGTLFLDEVSEIPMQVQVKLLRFLQEREFERVGGNQTIRVDVRIVAATNRDLSERVAQGLFREDLFYRLNVVSLEVPPLRKRRSDIPRLAQAFLKRCAIENERDVRGFAPDALEKLMAYNWPGNVRELENTVERAVVMSSESLIEAEHLLVASKAQQRGDRLDVLVPGISMNEVERLVILKTLAANGGSTGKTSQILGISRRKIQYRLKEWGITAQEIAGVTSPEDAQ